MGATLFYSPRWKPLYHWSGVELLGLIRMGFQLIPPLYYTPTAYYADLPGRRFCLSAYYGQPSACVYAPTDPVYWEVFTPSTDHRGTMCPYDFNT